MRSAMLFVCLLTLAACRGGPPRDPEPAPPPPPAPAPKVEIPVETLEARPVAFARSVRAGEELRANADAVLRALLEDGEGRYRLVESGGSAVLDVTFTRLDVREVGAGSAFTMRDLGLDPGKDWAIADLELSGRLATGSRTVESRIAARVRAGDDTPGVTRADRNGDGRLEMVVTPEGYDALLRPAFLQLLADLAAKASEGEG